jgi:hypothetical protein
MSIQAVYRLSVRCTFAATVFLFQFHILLLHESHVSVPYHLRETQSPHSGTAEDAKSTLRNGTSHLNMYSLFALHIT